MHSPVAPSQNAPAVVVIDPEGKIVFRRSGMPTDDEILEAVA